MNNTRAYNTSLIMIAIQAAILFSVMFLFSGFINKTLAACSGTRICGNLIEDQNGNYTCTRDLGDDPDNCSVLDANSCIQASGQYGNNPCGKGRCALSSCTYTSDMPPVDPTKPQVTDSPSNTCKGTCIPNGESCSRLGSGTCSGVMPICCAQIDPPQPPISCNYPNTCVSAGSCNGTTVGACDLTGDTVCCKAGDGPVVTNPPLPSKPPIGGTSCTKKIDKTYAQCGCNAGGKVIGIGSSAQVEKWHNEGAGCDTSPQYTCLSEQACKDNICDANPASTSYGYCPAQPTTTPQTSTTPTPTGSAKVSVTQGTKPIKGCTIGKYSPDPKKPDAGKNVKLTITKVKSENIRCAALYYQKDANDPKLTSVTNGQSPIAGKYLYQFKSGDVGKHKVVMRFGVQKLYPGVDCGKQVTCNAGSIKVNNTDGTPIASPTPPITQAASCGDGYCGGNPTMAENYITCPADCTKNSSIEGGGDDGTTTVPKGVITSPTTSAPTSTSRQGTTLPTTRPTSSIYRR